MIGESSDFLGLDSTIELFAGSEMEPANLFYYLEPPDYPIKS